MLLVHLINSVESVTVSVLNLGVVSVGSCVYHQSKARDAKLDI